MPFVKFNVKEEIKRQCEKSPEFKRIYEENEIERRKLRAIGNYLSHGVGGVFNDCDADKDFHCGATAVRANGLIQCRISLAVSDRDLPSAEVTIYLRDVASCENLITMLDMYIPYACSRLMGQLAEKLLLDEDFREFYNMNIATKLIKESYKL